MNRSQRTALILFIVALFVYTIPLSYNALVIPFFHVVPAQDVVSAALVPASLLNRGNFYLDQFRRYVTNNYPDPYFVAEVNGHLVARTTIVSGILALPFVGWGQTTGWIRHTHQLLDLARLTAALITALTVVAFFFAARELNDHSTATLTTIAFAFGTGVWSTAASGLWQHTPSILFQSIAFGFLWRGIRAGADAAAPAGLFFSLATITRPPVLLIAIIFALYFWLRFRSAFIRFAVWTLPPLAFALYYNTTVNGSPLVFGYQDIGAQNFGLPKWESIQGLLFSPSRGLFVFSPFLLLAPIGVWQAKPRHFFWFAALASIAYIGLLAAWGSLGGWAYGARMMTDLLPVLCLMIIPAVARITGKWRGVIWGIVLIAGFGQSLGIWDYGLRFHRDSPGNLWSVAESEPLFYLRLYVAMIQDYFGF